MASISYYKRSFKNIWTAKHLRTFTATMLPVLRTAMLMISNATMLPMSRITMLAIMLLAVVVQYTEGNQRIVNVSEIISDDDFLTNGEHDNSHVCCMYGNCTCNSLDHALANLTSNVLINITTDVMLSSLIKLSDLQNISIIGHNNPTVNCKHLGGIHLTSCHNCIIEGIT